MVHRDPFYIKCNEDGLETITKMHVWHLISRFLFFKTSFIVLVTVLSAYTTNAQTGAGLVKGVLVDSATLEPVNGATISIYNIKDTGSHFLSVSSPGGAFKIANLAIGAYTLSISHQGMAELDRTFEIFEQYVEHDLDTLKLTRAYKVLKEVVVKDITPLKVTGDTISYKADVYTSKPNASVEDLLRKLPGVHIDGSGTIKAQGEKVQKIIIDGKEFFANDPKIATKNLTADMIDQVQVFNGQSEQTQFSGIDDGMPIKTINLKLKKEKKSGVFGKTYLGYGTNNRYQAGFNINYFKAASRFSIVAGSNNVNQTASNSIAPGGALQGGQGLSESDNGISRTTIAGLNYQDTWNENVEGNGSFVIRNVSTDNLQKSTRQTFLTDSTIQSNQQSNNKTSLYDHRFNFRLLYNIDSLNSIIYVPNYSLQHSRTSGVNFTIDNIINGVSLYKGSETHTRNRYNIQNYALTQSIIWRKIFRKRGRIFSALVTTINNRNDREGYNAINARFYERNGNLYQQRDADYKNGSQLQTSGQSVRLSFTEPLTRYERLEWNYGFVKSKNVSDQKTNTFNPATNHYDAAEDILSNLFRNDNRYHQMGMNLKGIHSKYNYQVGLTVQRMLVEGINKSEGLFSKQHYTNLIPAASFNYRLSKSKNLQLTYRGRSHQPTPLQLQDATDVSDYPIIRKGNRALQQEFTHNLMATYNAYNVSKERNIFAFFTYSNTRNKIVNSIVQRVGEQVRMPVNIDGIYSVQGTIDVGFPIKGFESATLNTSSQMQYNQQATVINGNRNFTRNVVLGEQVTFNYTLPDHLDLSLDIGVNYNTFHYSIQKEQNITYFTNELSLDATYSFTHGIWLSTSLNYINYAGTEAAVGQRTLIWNMSLNKSIFKNKRGDFSISAHDLLNQSKRISRNVYENVTEDVEILGLRRFFQLTFSYKLNQLLTKNRAH
jgi:hypothetical protein